MERSVGDVAAAAAGHRRWSIVGSIRVQVVDRLREAIITGELKPGQRLKQDALCEDFGVSPAPIREALRQLESEGLVEHFPNRGTFVADVSSEEYLGVLLPVRAAIESYAVPRAAAHLTPEIRRELEELVSQIEDAANSDSLLEINELDLRFHELTVEAAGSIHALQLWRAVAPRIRAQIFRLSPRHRNLQEIAHEHRLLLDSLLTGDPDAIRTAVEDHIIGSARQLLSQPRQDVGKAATSKQQGRQ
jgi:DNA-binding GntR family transcriptional regulator